MEPQTIRGMWIYSGAEYEDELLRFVVDVEDTSESQQFFIQY